MVHQTRAFRRAAPLGAAFLLLASTAVAADDGTSVRASVAPVIDGKRDAVWSKAVVHRSSHALHRHGENKLKGAKDFSVSWRSLWTADALYFLIDIEDDINKVDGPAQWDDDNVEIWMWSSGRRDDAWSDKHPRLFSFKGTRGDTKTREYHHKAPSETAHLERAGGWAFEIKIPFAGMQITPEEGRLIGLELQVEDDDDGAKQDTKLQWFAATDEDTEHPDLKGAIRLVSRAPVTAAR